MLHHNYVFIIIPHGTILWYAKFKKNYHYAAVLQGDLLLKRTDDVIILSAPTSTASSTICWASGDPGGKLTRVRATATVPDNVQRPLNALSSEAAKASARLFWQAPARPAQATVVYGGHSRSGWFGAVYWDSRLHCHYWTTR